MGMWRHRQIYEGMKDYIVPVAPTVTSTTTVSQCVLSAKGINKCCVWSGILKHITSFTTLYDGYISLSTEYRRWKSSTVIIQICEHFRRSVDTNLNNFGALPPSEDRCQRDAIVFEGVTVVLCLSVPTLENYIVCFMICCVTNMCLFKCLLRTLLRRKRVFAFDFMVTFFLMSLNPIVIFPNLTFMSETYKTTKLTSYQNKITETPVTRTDYVASTRTLSIKETVIR